MSELARVIHICPPFLPQFVLLLLHLQRRASITPVCLRQEGAMQNFVLENVDTKYYSDFEEEDDEFHVSEYYDGELYDDGEYHDGSSIDTTESTEWCPLPLPGKIST
jgi:hypothetical protein